ncbi:MAG: SDR family oxidoreductase [Flavobacteriaceae bacterium]|nr:SDR family oxidoreductase [Flavobacteriaceae bacterium]
MNNKILVIGGTGTTGRELLNILNKNQVEFKALVRNSEKAKELEKSGISTVKGTLGDWDRISNVLTDFDTIFLLTGASPENIDHQNGLIDHANSVGVKKIVKISAVVAETGSPVHLADWHGQIEDHLKNSGLEYVILRPHSFMQNMLMSLPTIKEQDVFYESIGDGQIPMVDARDVALASYHCLINNNFNNGTYVITGPSSIGYSDVAKSLSETTNRIINYIKVPSEAHNHGMKAAGLPDWLADDLTQMSKTWAKSNDKPTDDFKKITGCEPRSIHQFTKDYASYFNS